MSGRPLRDFDWQSKPQIRQLHAKVFQDSFVYRLAIVTDDPSGNGGTVTEDIVSEMSTCGSIETRFIPLNHVIVGVYGTLRHPKGSPKRVTSLGFILMNLDP